MPDPTTLNSQDRFSRAMHWETNNERPMNSGLIIVQYRYRSTIHPDCPGSENGLFCMRGHKRTHTRTPCCLLNDKRGKEEEAGALTERGECCVGK